MFVPVIRAEVSPTVTYSSASDYSGVSTHVLCFLTLEIVISACLLARLAPATPANVSVAGAVSRVIRLQWLALSPELLALFVVACLTLYAPTVPVTVTVACAMPRVSRL